MPMRLFLKQSWIYHFNPDWKVHCSNGKFKMAIKKSGFQMVNSRWLPKSPDFKWSIQDGCQKVRISNGQYKMAAKNYIFDTYRWFSNAICKTAYSTPFEIRTCLDFRSPLYTFIVDLNKKYVVQSTLTHNIDNTNKKHLPQKMTAFMHSFHKRLFQADLSVHTLLFN